jgi:hypothetical protein
MMEAGFVPCCVPRVPSLRDSVPLFTAYPALTCGANEWRRWRDWARLAQAWKACSSRSIS